ncbi:phage tail sheath family protein [Chromobacterium haemolyticum]|uniref:phage tail sheath family protein n=1 Tax=Chromobacterium haemolyticum TaxID=394935 RepID=UPI002447FE61|nr:phage tail sheath C-terminal domain-containing protein [Chromobacterium haemolyticum]MDH0342420.1 phage tail sheath subtilisin-like domain-containing protein [Chromobacterium haemolyticum]
MATSTDWNLPGVHLTESMRDANEFDLESATAVPIFIGWDENKSGGEAGNAIQKVATWSSFLALTENNAGLQWVSPTLKTAIRLYFDNGGGTCYVMETPFQPKSDTSFKQEHFLPLLQEMNVTLLAIPQLVGWAGSDEKKLANAWLSVFQTCRQRQNVFYVLDAPLDPGKAVEFMLCFQNQGGGRDFGQHAALYGPHLQTAYDEASGSDVKWVPPSGAVLGLMARVDEHQGVWKAPANEVLMQVVAPSCRETQIKNWFHKDKPSINLIRSFPGRGVRVWGCRTQCDQAASPYRFVQVRRTVGWIEENLRQISRFAVFEPNNEMTWIQLHGLCSGWLKRVWLSGGLAGMTEEEAFSVRVGLNVSMTAEDIDMGKLIVKVGLAVLRPAEFVDVNLILTLNNTHSEVSQLTGGVA